MTSKFILVLVSLGVLSLSSCVTIVKGSDHTVTITTDPPGASLIINGEHVGSSPITTGLPRSENVHIYATKDSMNGTYILHSRFDPLSLVDLLFFPAFIVDLLSGAAYDLDREAIHIVLHEIPKE